MAGPRGQTLRRWLALDGDELYARFYCASVTRCYPGRPASDYIKDQASSYGLKAQRADIR